MGGILHPLPLLIQFDSPIISRGRHDGFVTLRTERTRACCRSNTLLKN